MITYTYDPLYRLRGAYYSTGEFFAYTYDAVGNRLSLTTTGSVVNYQYDAANRLLVSSSPGHLVSYTWDANGNLTHQTPNGTAPADGQVRYTWDALNRLVKVERYAGGSYEPLAEMAYDGSLPLRAKRVGDDVHVGQRTRLTMWVAGQPLTTTYTADPLRPGRVLVAADGTTARRYLYGQGPIGEFDGAWSYYLRDGQGSLRQVTDGDGAVVLWRTYKPFGALWEQEGSGDTAYGFLSLLRDAGTGLLYWDGRYYDPVTGRFLSPQPGRRNPYSPYGMPLTMGLLAPLVVWSAAFGKRRRRWWHWLLLLVLVGMGVVAVGCEGETTPSTPTIPLPPTLPPPPTSTPTQPPPTSTYTPPPPTPTHTPTLVPPTCTPIPTPTIEQRAEVTVEEIQLAGGTPEAYFRQEGIDDPVMLLARAMWAEGKSSTSGSIQGNDRTMANVGWIAKVRVLGWGSTYSSQITLNAFQGLRNRDVLDPLNSGGPKDQELFRVALARAEKMHVHTKVPGEYKTENGEGLDSFLETSEDKYTELEGDRIHRFFSASTVDDDKDIWDPSLHWND